MTAKLKDELSRITYDDLHAALTGSPQALGVHLELIERDIEIDGHSVRIHCHCLEQILITMHRSRRLRSSWRTRLV